MKAKDLIQVLPHVEPESKAVHSAKTSVTNLVDDFVFVRPLGEILMSRVWIKGKQYVQQHTDGAEHMCIIKPWWCPPAYIKQYEALCKDWTDNGFSFHVGTHAQGVEPDVIPSPEYERGPSKPFCASTKGYIAKTGWKKLWLEIDDPVQAYAFIQTRHDIPLPITMDCFKYDRDETYRKVYDVCREYFWYFFEYMTPRK